MAAQLTTIIDSVGTYAATLLSWFWPALAFAGGMMLAAWIVYQVVVLILAVIGK